MGRKEVYATHSRFPVYRFFFYEAIGSTKGTDSVPETLEKFHTLTQLSDREGIIEICHCVFSMISICVWCRSSNYKWATGKTWAVSVAGGYYNRVNKLLRWISHIWHVGPYSSSLRVSILQECIAAVIHNKFCYSVEHMLNVSAVLTILMY